MRYLSLIPLLLPALAVAQPYSAGKITDHFVEVVRLQDAGRKIEVLIAPTIGNIAYTLSVNGKNAFFLPYPTVPECREKKALPANVFLAPWSNRLDADAAFWANGKRYFLNRELDNIRWDRNKKPIHGLLLFSPHWKVTRIQADKKSAEVTSRLEFWRYPDLMAQFPFAHNLEMAYRLSEGRLEVLTRIENLANEPMPVGIGYHPFFRLHDSPHSDWRIHIPVSDQAALKSFSKEGMTVDSADGDHLVGTVEVTGLIRDSQGRARFSFEGKSEKVTVIMGPKYTAAIATSPAASEFVSFEPLAAISNGFNLAHAGAYKELQSIAPGGIWQESFWIEVSGF